RRARQRDHKLSRGSDRVNAGGPSRRCDNDGAMRAALSSIEPFDDDSAGPAVHGFLHRPAGPPGRGLVLAHGAGSDCEAPLLVAVATAFARAGVTVLRCDLPFRQAYPAGPP